MSRLLERHVAIYGAHILVLVGLTRLLPNLIGTCARDDDDVRLLYRPFTLMLLGHVFGAEEDW